jgi:hypothetical protein
MPSKMKWIKTILPFLAICALALFYWPDQPTYMPEKVWGIWKTDDPRYAGRYLDISEAVFAIGQGRQRLQVFFFQHVDINLNGPHERYTLYYRPHERAKSSLQRFSFDFIATDAGPRIKLKNQKHILWYRETNPPPASADSETARS